MNDIAATIGLEELKYVDKNISKNQKNANYFLKNLSGVKDLTLLSPQQNSKSNYWLFTILVQNKDKFKAKMLNRNIMVSEVHRRNDAHPVVAEFKSYLPHLDKFSKNMICIPVGWWLNNQELQFIVSSIKSGW